MPVSPVGLYILCSAERVDEDAREELRKHLAPLERDGLIKSWHAGLLQAGAEVHAVSSERFRQAQVLVLLLSPDLLASAPHVQQAQQALAEQKTVLPVLVRSSLWQQSPIGHLQPLPRDGTAIALAADRDQAWLAVVNELQRALPAAAAPLPPSPRSSQPPAAAAARGDSLPQRLRSLAEHAHDAEIAAAVSALRGGDYVALEAPAGFGASRCIEEVARRCQGAPDMLVHYVPPRTLSGSADAFLEEVYSGLKARAVPLPGTHPRRKRDDWLFKELRDAALVLHGRGQRLVLAIDNVEKFPEPHQAWLHQLLGALAHLADYWVTDPELRAVTVVVAGGEWLQRHLAGTVKASALSPFNKAQPILLGPARVADGDAESAAVVDAVGGHPRLLRWAADRGGHTDGDPAAEPGLFRQQVERFRRAPYRKQLARMLGGDFRDPDLALRWSGWLRVGQPSTGWLGPVLMRLARACVTE